MHKKIIYLANLTKNREGMQVKRIDEMSKKKILELTNEDIATLIDLECAYEGIPLLPDCPSKPEVINHEKDLAAYEIAGYYFLTSEEASRVLEVLQSADTYIKEGWNDDAQLKKIKDGDYYCPKIETRKFYSQQKLGDIKNELEEDKQLIVAYENKKKNYDAIFEKRKKVADRVCSIINEIKEDQEKQQLYSDEFNRYLKLANNNQEVAMNFLLKAYREIELDFPEIVTKLCPGYYSVTEEGIC